MNRIMIVAGEASGDLHGAGLVRQTLELAPDIEFFGMGGCRLREAGARLLFDLENMSLMGLSEIVSRIRYAWDVLNSLKRVLIEERPAALVLIDYPDFNFRLGKAARSVGVPVFYYVCPQVWAWRTGRVRQMARFADRLVVLFPFEVEFYRRYGIKADFVGHPLLDVMDPPRPKAEVKAELGFDPERPLLALMPGSREPLVRELLPVLLEAASLMRKRRPELALAIPRASTLEKDFLDAFLAGGPEGVRIIEGDSHRLQNAADAVVAASGTSTLETALMLTPLLAVYRMRPLSFHILRWMQKTEFVSIPNLIADRPLVPELLQKEARPDRIAAELERLMNEPETRDAIIEGFQGIRDKLGRPGASRRAAGLLLETMGRGA